MAPAIKVDNVNFSYGKNSILRNYCSRIYYGQIYSLLGPSGGGKTTLLKLLLGRLNVQNGSISVLGMEPGEANSNISFMPQEIGLCYNFNINQTLRYFKLIYQISNEEFYARRKVLSKLVNLPNGKRLVSQLSGGTQRRLSIAVSLINDPCLVILDEPTVGIDAVLRNQIWEYLVSKSREGMTILIVTHYIEEAANSDRVGMMRNGRLLAEDDPKRLLSLYNEPNLESVFLKLCCVEDRQNEERHHGSNQSSVKNPFSYEQYEGRQYSNSINNNNSGSSNNNNNVFIIEDLDDNQSRNSRTPSTKSSFFISYQMLKVKLWILFTLVYPTQALIYCLAVSRGVVELKAAVFDEENEPGYGEEFIKQLKMVRRYTIQPTRYESLDLAIEAVHNGSMLGALWIPKNYTESLDTRLDEAFAADNETVEGSTIKLFMDNSMYIESLEFFNALVESFQDYSKKIFREQDNYGVDIPIEIEMTKLSENFRFSDYYFPGYFLLFMYISQITVASLTLTQERKDGMFERSLIAGVTHELVFISHIITSCIISIIQILLLDLTAFVWFDYPNNSTFWLQFSFFILLSLNAMSIGFVISSLINNEVACLILVWFITIPQILSSGIFWPLESIDRPLVYLFYLWPLSIPVNTIRHIMLRGWDLSNEYVQYGFLSSGIPMIFFFYAALLIFKHK
ncbi:hypothetical protein RDWZM_005093 [Blomia tropicalis]|uniref:Uncharacterized protein n=1 Tax=Blomia tropicalis TaxID=40697 RepID=A0A9Q0RN66_BLOTA|nr:hypothetical protein RDWZM_005093 [Blomia tropicalis]